MNTLHRQSGVRVFEGSIDLSDFNIPHEAPFLCELHVPAEDLSEVIAHVSNVEYVRWLDRAAELHGDSLGYTRAWMLEQGRMWFVARHEIDYLAEAWRGDHLIIATWIRGGQRAKAWRDYTVFRPADSTVICRAATLWVWVNLDSRRPARIDREMARRFNPLIPNGPTRG